MKTFWRVRYGARKSGSTGMSLHGKRKDAARVQRWWTAPSPQRKPSDHWTCIDRVNQHGRVVGH